MLGGCGGDASEAEPPPPQRATLPGPVAQELTAHSDQIAALLDAGDVCGAAHEADALNAAAIEAINGGHVPPELQEELLAAAQDLVNRINCPPPPPAETETETEAETETETQTATEPDTAGETETQAKTEPLLDDLLDEVDEDDSPGNSRGKGRGKKKGKKK